MSLILVFGFMNIVLISQLSRIRRQIRVARSERQDLCCLFPSIQSPCPSNVQEPYRNPLFYACHPYMIIDKEPRFQQFGS